MAEAKGKGGKDADRQKSVFVITPIGAAGSPEREHADFVLHGAIEPIFGAKGYKVERADKMADPAMINDGIFNAIFEADICIADLTFTNANVFYELGVRHTLLKPVIHIADEETRIPFDNAQHRAILFRRSNWASFEGLKAGLLAQLEAIEEEGFKVSNPITHARGRIEVAKSGDDRDKLISDLMARMDQMERSTWKMPTEGRNALLRPIGVNAARRQKTSDDLNKIADSLNRVFATNAFVHENNIELLEAELKREFGDGLMSLSSAEKSDLFDHFSQKKFSEKQMSALGTILYGF